MAAVVGPYLQQMMKRYGLEGLAPWLSGRIINDASEEQIMLELYERPEFRHRFPAIKERELKGMTPISVEEYIQYETVAKQTARALGLTLSYREVSNLIAANVSVQEAQERLSIASRAVYQTDTFTKQELNRLYGITGEDLIRYWLDPKQTGAELERRFVSAGIAGEARRAGFDEELEEGKLWYLYKRGMTAETSAEAFGTLVENEELLEAVDETEEDFGIEDKLKLITGDADLQGEVERRAGKRTAKFQEGGSFSTGRTGVAGLGKATS